MTKNNKKTNPRRISATEADVKSAFVDGIDLGVKQALKIVLYILLDKHDAPVEDVRQLASEISWLADHINNGRISWSFVDKILSENNVEVKLR